jgi:FKBP-type peptidyl-prolyl cis-trans isomerase 2
MTQVKPGDTVRIHCVGKLVDGTVFLSSANRDPVQFTIGGGQVFPGLEQAVIGMVPGESRTVKIPAEKAYGPHRREKVFVLDRKQLPEDMKPEVGQRLKVHLHNGRPFVVRVIQVDEVSITVDANHSFLWC